MELGQIKYFILTAKLQNMSKAALALNIAQPTLSKSITNLEKELGTQLFDRSGKKLILNERGKRFLESVEPAMEELENAAVMARDQIADFTLNVGLFCMSERLIGCLGKFSNQHPELLFNVNYLYDNLDKIDTNEFDILIYPREPLFRRYRGQRAYMERYLLAVHRDNPLAAKSQVSLSDVQNENLIFMKCDTKRYDNTYYLYRSFVKLKKNYNFCNSYEIQRLMISFNQGIGFVPEGSAGAYLGDDNIVLVPIVNEGFEQEVFIGFKREKHLSENGRLFAAFVTEYFELNAEG